MAVVVITPAGSLVELTAVKEHLNILFDDDDALLEGLIAAVSDHLDGPDGWLGRAVGLQTLEWWLPAFPRLGPLLMPFGPLVDIVSVKYDAIDNSELTWSAGDYRVHGGRLLPGFGRSWPTARCDPLAVRIQFRAGFEETPPAVRVAVMMIVAELYAAREPVTAAQLAERPKSGPVQMLLARTPRV
ncbi:MAG: hypothetical protein JWP92_3732 [Caulobacter sp.]|nr:hypothetical protein [Caulobacter sp.]